jgi:hypothetical protein
MSLLPNLDQMTDNEKLAVLESIQKSIAESKEIQKKKIGENVDLVVQALKKIESDIQSRFDAVGNTIEKRVASIQDGRNGSNGIDGRDGKDGKSGRDGAKGDKGDAGQNGRDGVDGVDGVSVVNANIDFDGSLIISLSDGREINVGEVVSADIAEKIKVISTMSTNGAIAVKEEGTTITSGVKSINFVGTGITATTSGDDVTVTVAGGGGSGTVTSVAALTLGTSGTDLSSTVANSTTTPVITLNVPTASATNRGALSSADWTTFNSKGSGTVTSVTGTSPVSSTGGATPALSLEASYGDTQNPYASKTANYVLAAPNGSAGVPTFRAVVAADIPTLNQSTTGTASNVTGTVAVANGGSGQTTAQLAINAFAGAVTSGSYLRGNGTNVVMSTIQAADVPTLNQNTTGSAATVTTTINSGVVATTQTAGDNSTKVATTAYVNAITGTSGITGFKNRIINGAMVIDQRNAGASVTPNGTYVVDRWIYENSQTSKFTAQQNQNSVTPPAGFTYYSGLTSSSAYTLLAGDYFLYRQKIEGYNIADLAWGTASAATVTLSFWVRSSLTGTFGGALVNGSSNRSYPFTYAISAANTWEQKSITIAGDTSGTWLTTNGIGLHVGFSLGTGSTYSGTAGAWSGSLNLAPTGAVSVVGTNGATWYVTGVQLEKGSTATSFDYRPYGTELALCQRYCPTWSTPSASSNFPFTGQAYLTSAAIFLCTYPVQPRVAATGITTTGTFAASISTYSPTPNGTLAIYSTGTNLYTMGLSLTATSGLVAGNSTQLLGTSVPATIIATGCEL